MKIVLKVLALPLLFIVTVACILGNMLANLSSYVIALLLHLLHRKGTVDFPGYPCRYGINGNPYNLPVGMGSCKT